MMMVHMWSPDVVYVMIVVYHQQNCELLGDDIMAHLEVLLGNGCTVSRNDFLVVCVVLLQSFHLKIVNREPHQGFVKGNLMINNR